MSIRKTTNTSGLVGPSAPGLHWHRSCRTVSPTQKKKEEKYWVLRTAYGRDTAAPIAQGKPTVDDEKKFSSGSKLHVAEKGFATRIESHSR